MKLPVSPGTLLITAIIVTGIVVTVRPMVRGSDGSTPTAIKVPELSAVARSGQTAFDANCASCHGALGTGSSSGPRLMHEIYNPGHHSDESIRRAVRNGVQQHHWRFGNMPAQSQVSDTQLGEIVRYLRELQLANGIRYQPHRM